MADLLDRPRGTWEVAAFDGVGAGRARRRADFAPPPRLFYEAFMTRRKKRRGGKKTLAFAGDSHK
jgi:hypothetical protein